MIRHSILLFCLSFIIVSCEKDIDIDLPEYEQKVVVDGRIEQGLPPIVFLNKSQKFFGETDLAAFQNSFVNGAEVIVSDGTTTDTLVELCTGSLPQGYDTIVANFLGVNVADLAFVNICAYTSVNPNIFGEVGKSYALTINHEGSTYTSSTSIPQLVPLDSVWFKAQPAETQNGIEYGFSWATMTDPDTVGNGYRWFARRLNMKSDGSLKDPGFLAPIGTAFDDQFIGGLTFDFAYDRPRSDGDESPDRTAYFRSGDTVVIKFCTIETEIVDFIRAAETQALNNGSPFATPTNNPSNIEGGALGIWAGYGVTYDTIYVPQ